MRAVGMRRSRMLLLVAGLVAVASCVDEDVVFEDRPIYEQVAAEAGGFVGYADPSDDDKLTVCGACHGDMQAQWERTRHAFAWEGLQSSGHAQAFCEACHTVNSLGNVAQEPEPGEAVGGHAAVATARYRDVQCESCHGPGLEHVLDPGVGNVPLAPILTGTDLSFGCGECHSGTHHPFVEEWQQSAHAMPGEASVIEDESCYSCHSGEGGLERLGVTADYLEKEELRGPDHIAAITCAVCHDPHGSDNAAQLRWPIETETVSEHLCAACHDRQAEPDLSGEGRYVRTHAPAAGLMAGTAGWFPPGSGLTPGDVQHPHTGADRLCASCHVVTYAAVDEATGEEFFSQGHRFLAAPCVDPATGRPAEDQGCALTADARDYRGCLECHESEEATAALLLQATNDLLPRVRQLVARLNAIDPSPTGAGGEIDPTDITFTVAEGAYFNYTIAVSADGLPTVDEFARRRLAAALVHNPTLVEALVDASLAALDEAYAVSSLETPGSAAPETTPAAPAATGSNDARSR